MLEIYNYKVNFGDVKNYWEIHEILDESLQFAEYYGGDLDSLYDCLTDMLCDISIIEVYGIERLKKYDGYDQRLIEVFSDAKHAYENKFSDRFFVTIVHEDGTREEIS